MHRDAAAFIDRLHTPGTVLLDTARPDAENQRCLLFAHPRQVLTAATPDDIPGLLDQLDDAVGSGSYVAGYLSYEAGYAFEQIAPLSSQAQPLAWFGVYDAPYELMPSEVETLLETVRDEAIAIRNERLDIERAAYHKRIAAIKEHIREGNVYQINFTDRILFDVEGDPVALYRALRQKQRVPYGAFLNDGVQHILCCSPELFFRREGERIWTRPMKGTVRRGHTLAEDRALQRWLAEDAKSQAENLMIVDLLRNDLSVCCRPGSVTVPALFATERYETLIQMTSTVEGQLRDGIGYADLFRALFPCGSVTGAPKIRAMQLIHGLESGPRDVYCGAIGYVAPEAQAVFNVAIRTIVLQDGHGVMGTGSGIVWDSDPDAEYDECRLKAQFLADVADPGLRSEDVELIETMRYEGGTIPLFELHVDRLRSSVQYFDVPFDEQAYRTRVETTIAELPPKGCYKVRTTVDQQGCVSISTSEIEAQPDAFQRVLLSDRRIDSDRVFQYHKTTRRRFYDEAFRRAQEAGFDEVLFLNERGEVAEGSRTNVFVRKGDVLVTPPIESGVLGGVYRRRVLETRPEAQERVLTLDDLLEADAVFLCNAVRELQPVGEVVALSRVRSVWLG